MVVEFYYDLLSQPCRAVYMFFKAAGIAFEAKEIDLFKGEHHNPEFTKKNPYHKVPIIEDDGFILAERLIRELLLDDGKIICLMKDSPENIIRGSTCLYSVKSIVAAIMRYMATKENVAEHWFPRQDLQKQAKVDELINWQHLCVRKPCVELFIAKFRSRIAIGRFTKEPADEAKLKTLRGEIEKSLKHIADYFLQDNLFLVGNEISLADILVACEIYHLQGVEEDSLYKDNAKVFAWIERVRKELAPDFDAASMKLMAVKQKYVDAKE